MNSYTYLLDLALILLSTKVFGLLTRKVRMPQVVRCLRDCCWDRPVSGY